MEKTQSILSKIKFFFSDKNESKKNPYVVLIRLLSLSYLGFEEYGELTEGYFIKIGEACKDGLLNKWGLQIHYSQQMNQNPTPPPKVMLQGHSAGKLAPKAIEPQIILRWMFNFLSKQFIIKCHYFYKMSQLLLHN